MFAAVLQAALPVLSACSDVVIGAQAEQKAQATAVTTASSLLQTPDGLPSSWRKAWRKAPSPAK
ncbi:TPA: hypothetical protein H2X16_004324 [Salmonella enterica]|nr:hypothetical protein [Salmonella enterica]